MTMDRNGNMRPFGTRRGVPERRGEETLTDRLRSWAQNEEMIDQHFTAHGRDCEQAVEVIADLLAALKCIKEVTESGSMSLASLYKCGTVATAAIAKARGV